MKYQLIIPTKNKQARGLMDSNTTHCRGGQQHTRQGPWMGNDNRQALVWAMAIPHEWAMNKIPNEWGMKMGHEWPMESFPMTGQ